MAANIIHTPEAKKKIKDKLEEISNSYTRIAAEKDLIKTIIGDISEEFQIPKKQVSQMAKVFHNDSFKKVVEEKTEFEVLYETITGQSADE